MNDVTGLVLAGGRGSRMGGIDKGLQMLDGEALAQRALQRLGPQVQALAINANRHLNAYRAFGVPVWPDTDANFVGPLAGFLVGLEHCRTEWLATVPCDTPNFPVDIVARLATAVGGSSAAVAVTETQGRRQRESVFCLLRRSTAPDLAGYLRDGGRKIEHWLLRQGCVDVVFDDAAAFFNANTIDDLRALGRIG